MDGGMKGWVAGVGMDGGAEGPGRGGRCPGRGGAHVRGGSRRWPRPAAAGAARRGVERSGAQPSPAQPSPAWSPAGRAEDGQGAPAAAALQVGEPWDRDRGCSSRRPGSRGVSV